MTRCNLAVLVALFLVASVIVGAADAQAQTNVLPPQSVSASDGTYSWAIAISWFPGNVPEENGCQIYRSISNDAFGASLIADWVSASNMWYWETSAVSGQVYYFWMK